MSIDMSEFRALPGHPAYSVAKDGRVLSLKKREPAILAEQGRTNRPELATVKIGGVYVRVRDLAWLVWGARISRCACGTRECDCIEEDW